MPRDFASETLWQEEPSAIWYTDVKPVCDLCGEKSERVIEFKVSEEDEGNRVCFLTDRDCMHKAMALMFAQNPDIGFLRTREIEFKPIGIGAKKRGNVRREPIGLSKRYAVMKRDGFQCVLCGASGRTAQLEIENRCSNFLRAFSG